MSRRLRLASVCEVRPIDSGEEEEEEKEEEEGKEKKEHKGSGKGTAFQRLRRRRQSHDQVLVPREFLVDVERTWALILRQEDTDGDHKITIHDNGPKVLSLGSLRSEGYLKSDVRGTYVLSILLQELAMARERGEKRIVVSDVILNENPVERLSRMIRTVFWGNLVRSIDRQGLLKIAADPKAFSRQPRIYVPADDRLAFRYFHHVAQTSPELNLEVVQLPREITPDYVKSINHLPGILALQLRRKGKGGEEEEEEGDLLEGDLLGGEEEEDLAHVEGVPFVVPGGRFNEMYGWDSYFIALGLLQDGEVRLAQGMVRHMVYEIAHYGKILNANRSYYLSRSQPPFLTDMALHVAARLHDLPAPDDVTHDDVISRHRAWLASCFRAAIKEYHGVWCAPPRLVPSFGLSRYYDPGIGMPPETEPTHFDAVLGTYAQKHGVPLDVFRSQYDQGLIVDHELDQYFIHDRAVRESGHDTTYRLDGKCAHLLVVELNALLYKYEIDIANTIKDQFDDNLDGQSSAIWYERAQERKERLTRYCWNEEKGIFFDYNFSSECQSDYASVTTLFPLWAGCVSQKQAERIIDFTLKNFEKKGGLVSGLEESRGPITLDRPSRQWDYPCGWAPHQIIAWEALVKWGYPQAAQRLAYKWLYMITQSYVDFNGTVPEKYDVVEGHHFVHAEYGNVGTDFSFVSKEGFGWMNSSFQLGLTYLTSHQLKALKALVPPEDFFKKPR